MLFIPDLLLLVGYDESSAKQGEKGEGQDNMGRRELEAGRGNKEEDDETRRYCQGMLGRRQYEQEDGMGRPEEKRIGLGRQGRGQEEEEGEGEERRR